MAPKIFWSADRQKGSLDKGFTKGLNPDGCLMQWSLCSQKRRTDIEIKETAGMVGMVDN